MKKFIFLFGLAIVLSFAAGVKADQLDIDDNTACWWFHHGCNPPIDICGIPPQSVHCEQISQCVLHCFDMGNSSTNCDLKLC